MSLPGSITWRPSATWQTLAVRARLLGAARQFFAARGITEVETPVLLSHGVTDPHLTHLAALLAGPPRRQVLLHTSPEFHMKRLLAAGAPDIYQICKVFRDGERGQRHEPEFTLIEWYRHGFDLEAMARETCDLIRHLGAGGGNDPGAARWITYQEAFREQTGVDPLEADGEALKSCAMDRLGAEAMAAVAPDLGSDPTAWQDLLMGHVVIPALAPRKLHVVHRYPAAQAALARPSPEDPRTAERFEVFWGSVELANGYHELADAAEQARRFQADRAIRRRLGREDVDPDARLLAALDAGLPDCAGVALGFDRLVMATLGLTRIRETISFPAPED